MKNQKGKKSRIRIWFTSMKKVLEICSPVIMPVVLAMQAFLLMVGMQAVTFADYNVLYKWLSADNLGYILYGFLLFYLVLQFLFCLFKRLTPGYVIMLLFTVAISVINNMKWVSLKECVTISDFEKLKEAATVAGEAEFKLFADIWVCITVAVMLFVVLLFLDCMILNAIRKNRIVIYRNRMTLLILVMVLIPVIVADARGSAVAKLTETRSADKTGPIVYFVESIFTSYLDEPYTLEEAKNSYYEYVEKGKRIVANESETSNNSTEKEHHVSDVQPNIIVIMSEAFYDVNQFEGVLSYSENPMAYYEEVQAESVAYGNTRVNIYGGSTHFSEFEFLTGWNSKGMNSGSCPYKEYYNQNQPSLAQYMKEQGYYTLAIHPYDSFFWNRKRAYPNMGFDQFIDRSWMEYTDMCGYISDDALTNEIIYRYEERQGNENEPFFCFGVSIANHVAMINREEFVDTANHIDITYNKNVGYGERKQQRLKDYIGGISKAGEALKKLTVYFEEQEEPTVIVFFGDHAPNYATDILELKDQEELSYSTPYLIWSNYDLGETEKCEDMNVSYLSTYLLQTLHMPLTEQCYYNIALREQYLFETRYEIKNTEGKGYSELPSAEKDAYFQRALDMKKHIPALLNEPDMIRNIWSVP